MNPKAALSLALIFSVSPVNLAFATGAAAEKWKVDFGPANGGGVEFNAIGKPSAIKIHGKGAPASGIVQVDKGKASGTLRFELDSLDTGIKLRNEHMKKKYLETEKFKEATLTLGELIVPDSLRAGDGSADSVPFQGLLSLHGIQKPVSGVSRLERKANQLTVRADFGIKVADFGIVSPAFAGVTMADDVQIHIESIGPVQAQ